MRGYESIDDQVISGLERIAEHMPDSTAIIFLGRRFSYGGGSKSSYTNLRRR